MRSSRPIPISGPPVVMVHGWGGSFDRTWKTPGVSTLIEEEGRPVIGIDLLGHGEAPKPHNPADYADMTQRGWMRSLMGQSTPSGFHLGP